MDKKIVMLGVVFGSVIGGYLPTLFGVSAFSMTSILCGGAGGIFGIWLAFRMIR